MELFEESFAEFYDSLRINFLYSQIMMESEGSSKSILDNIKAFFESIIRFIQKLANNIKEKFKELIYKENDIDKIVKDALEKVKSDPELKTKRSQYFDYTRYQKDVDSFMKEVTKKFDILITSYYRDQKEMKSYIDIFNQDVEELYQKYNFDNEDRYLINGSLYEVIIKAYDQQKKCKAITDYDIRQWNACIKNMQKQVNVMSAKTSKTDEISDKINNINIDFDKIKSGITKFCGYVGRAIQKIAYEGPVMIYNILVAGGIIIGGVSVASAFGKSVSDSIKHAKMAREYEQMAREAREAQKKEYDRNVVYTTLADT